MFSPVILFLMIGKAEKGPLSWILMAVEVQGVSPGLRTQHISFLFPSLLICFTNNNIKTQQG